MSSLVCSALAVVLRRLQPGPFDKGSHGIGRACAIGGPGVHLSEIDLEVVAFLFGIVDADLIEEATIAAHTGVRDDDAVVWAVLGAFAAESDDDGHKRWGN